MTEPPVSAVRESVPPAPPRWKGIQSLELVHKLNERCLELLCQIVSTALDSTLPFVRENRDLWARLAPEARRALGRIPFVIVDAHFVNAAWWQRASQINPQERAAGGLTNGLPPEASEHLMHETTIFAWQTARWDRTVAQLSLGMSPSVIEVISALAPQQIRIIATHEASAIRIRWASDASFWRDLLVAAEALDEKRLGTLHLHAKVLLGRELVQFRR